MYKVDIKEKWFCQFAKKAHYNISISEFVTISQKALDQFYEMEKKGISGEVICERIEEPGVLVRKTIEGNEAILRKGKLLVLWMLFISYCMCWYSTWPYYAVALKSLLIVFGILYIPSFIWVISGGEYYSVCASALKKESKIAMGIYILDIGIVICFLLLGIVVFPYALLSPIFSYSFMILFFAGFICFALWNMVLGMLKIRRLEMSGLKRIYMGNGMLQSFFLLALWNACSADFANHMYGFLGILLVPIPFAAEMLIVNMKKVLN